MSGRKRMQAGKSVAQLDAFAVGIIAALNFEGYSIRQIADSDILTKPDGEPVSFSRIGEVVRHLDRDPFWRGDRQEGPPAGLGRHGAGRENGNHAGLKALRGARVRHLELAKGPSFTIVVRSDFHSEPRGACRYSPGEVAVLVAPPRLLRALGNVGVPGSVGPGATAVPIPLLVKFSRPAADTFVPHFDDRFVAPVP